jgi:hypothetical protein
LAGLNRGEHVHDRLPPGGPLSGHDARRVVETVGQGQLNEDVLARVQGPHRDVRVQPGGQADIHQVHRTVTDHRVQVGGGDEPEVVLDLRQLLRRPAETTTSSTSERCA